MTTTRPTPEAIAADIHATAQAHKAGVITASDCKWRLDSAWLVASRFALTDATVRALATIDADARPFGPGTLDVLLVAEAHDVRTVCDAIDNLTGGVLSSWAECDDIVIPKSTLAALVRALRGGGVL